jgi:hypothetical protein
MGSVGSPLRGPDKTDRVTPTKPCVQGLIWGFGRHFGPSTGRFGRREPSSDTFSLVQVGSDRTPDATEPPWWSFLREMTYLRRSAEDLGRR